MVLEELRLTNNVDRQVLDLTSNVVVGGNLALEDVGGVLEFHIGERSPWRESREERQRIAQAQDEVYEAFKTALESPEPMALKKLDLRDTGMSPERREQLNELLRQRR